MLPEQADEQRRARFEILKRQHFSKPQPRYMAKNMLTKIREKDRNIEDFASHASPPPNEIKIPIEQLGPLNTELTQAPIIPKLKT